MQSYCPSLTMDEKCAIKELGRLKLVLKEIVKELESFNKNLYERNS